jgi:hypothetical protein
MVFRMRERDGPKMLITSQISREDLLVMLPKLAHLFPIVDHSMLNSEIFF